VATGKRWWWSTLALLLAAAGGFGGELGGALRDAEGRFLNRAGHIPEAGADVQLPFFARRLATTFTGREGAPPVRPNDGAFLRENAQHSRPTVTWVGHATLLVQMDHQTFLTDPTWSDTAFPVSWLGPSRFVPPGLALDDLPPIDFVLLSHDHYDHFDLPTLRVLARRSASTRFFVPKGNAELLFDEGIHNVRELDWGEVSAVGALGVVCLPAQHWSQRAPWDHRRRLWAAWAVVGPTRRLYFAGDGGYSPDFAAAAEFGPFDLAALPIGAYEPKAMMQPWHLNPEEALRAARDLGAKRVVPIHYGTFDLSDEPLDEPPRRFRAAAAAAGFTAETARVLEVGETAEF
jgi:N-acyl-phosphatidylethanolamine-hydrolysing phospholipase D